MFPGACRRKKTWPINVDEDGPFSREGPYHPGNAIAARGEDDDVLAFFARYPPRQRARALLMALRQGGVGRETAVGGAFNEAELLEALDDLLF